MIYCSCSYILSYLILFVTTTIMRFDKLAEVFKKSPLEVNMKYLSAKETAKKWGIGERRVQTLCLQDRIPGSIRIGNTWGIPDDAVKPKDERVKSGKYIKETGKS